MCHEDLSSKQEMIVTQSRIVKAGQLTEEFDLSRAAINRMLVELESHGLTRKGRGPGTHYDRAEFERVYAAWDTRPGQ